MILKLPDDCGLDNPEVKEFIMRMVNWFTINQKPVLVHNGSLYSVSLN